MSQKLTILFAPMEGIGHLNACIGVAEALQNRGHKIVFALSKIYKGKLTHYGFYEELLDDQHIEENTKTNTKDDQQKDKGLFSPLSPIEKMKIMVNASFLTERIETAIRVEPQLKQIVDKHKPDVYIIDNFIGSPTLIYSDKPWVFLFSTNPLFIIDDERTPPKCSGLPSNGDKTSEEWKEFKELAENMFTKQNIIYNKWLKENGFPTIEKKRCIPDSPYLNIYGFPEELDYTDIRPVPDKWFRIDAFIRKGEQEFVLPEKLKERDEKSQKLIYLSLGSIGSANVPLMKRLVQMLSKSSHKYIVSKGMLGDKYELADNMWGENSVPQTKVLPFVDLVITHGGNNTITETFSFGKPMIVMPLFADQFDNAQRVHEKRLGIRMDAYNCTEEELLDGIEKLLNDKELKDRLNAASKRIANSQSIVKAAQLIEDLVKNKN